MATAHIGTSVERKPNESTVHPATMGAILGKVELVACVTPGKIESPWRQRGCMCWVLQHPQELEKPIPYKGKLGLFEVNMEGNHVYKD